MSKKNQHYIPKFYLRYFSFEQNLKEIGIYNFKNNFFKQNVPLKHQCSKNFLYGVDGVIEDNLSKIEGQFDSFIKNIITTNDLNKSYQEELSNLLAFCVVTDMRSLTSIENLKDFPNRVNNLDLGYKFPDIGHERSVNIIFSLYKKIIMTVIDLDYKLLKNQSNTAFISSDFPISKYNLLFENQNKYFSTTGYKWKGLLIFLPISPSLTIVFFDKTTYKIGNKKDKVISITNNSEIDQLNLLQMLHSNEIVFFNEQVSLNYILSLKKLCEKYSKPNIPMTYKAKLLTSNGAENEMVVERSNNPNIKLRISSIKIHSGSKRQTIDPSKMTFRK